METQVLISHPFLRPKNLRVDEDEFLKEGEQTKPERGYMGLPGPLKAFLEELAWRRKLLHAVTFSSLTSNLNIKCLPFCFHHVQFSTLPLRMALSPPYSSLFLSPPFSHRWYRSTTELVNRGNPDGLFIHSPYISSARKQKQTVQSMENKPYKSNDKHG